VAARVLWVIKGLGPGGAERLLVSLAEVRDRTAVEYEVAYVLPWKQHLVGQLEASGVAVHLLSPRRGLADLMWPWRLRQLVARGRYDVVHVHSPSVAAVTRPLLRTVRPRVHQLSTEHNLWSSFGGPTRVLNAITLPIGDRRFAVSEEVKASMWPSRRRGTEVLLHGVSVLALEARRGERAAARAELGVGPEDVVIGTIANLRANKDYPTLLAAATEVLRSSLRARFVAVGQGPLAAELAAEASRLGLGPRFSFLGYREDPARVLAACDVFTLASKHEGLPIALLEAMAMGLPSAVTSVGGVPSMVDDDVEALLVPSGMPSRLAAELLRLVDDPSLRRRLGQAAALRATAFDITVTARTLEAIYAGDESAESG
jgi:glycosyltransferase involved in cell wall biosynthesis